MTRVYVPVAPDALRVARERGWLGPGPLEAHAVTRALEEALPDGNDEELEYAALAAAAVDCLPLLADGPALRVVVAADVDDVSARAGEDDPPSAVTVAGEVPLRRIASLLVDSADAEPDVVAARDAVRDGTEDQEAAVERCLEHELGWFGAQELDDVLAALGRT